MRSRTRTRRKPIAFATVSLALLAFSGALLAQQLTGNIFGYVTDEQGGRLPGVTVTLSGIGAPKTQTTDARGEYRFLNLSPGNYALSYELQGFSKVTKSDVQVAVGKNTETTSSMKLSSVEAAVTVRGEAALIDTRKVSTGAVVSQVELKEIPTARDPWVVLQTVPGVLTDRLNIGGDQSGQQSAFYGKGSLAMNNVFNLDGVNITDMAATGATGTYYDFDTFEEINATTGGSDITALTPGVQLNLVTKRGTNDIHGSARDFLTRGKWQSQNAPAAFLAQPKGQNLQPGIDTVQDYGVEVGGPIWRDHIWAWGAYGRNQVDLITSTGASDKTTLEDASAKLNFQITDSTAATANYTLGEKIKIGRNISLARPTAAEGWNQGGINGLPSALSKVEVSQVVSSKLFLTADYAYFRGGFQLVPGAGTAVNNVYLDDNTGVWHNSYQAFHTQRPLHNVGANGSFFFNTGSAGHELKFGFGYRKAGVVSSSAWPGNGNYGELNYFGAGLDAAVLTRPSSTKGTLNYYNAYAGDTITFGNLTINAGVRYDVQSGYNQAGASPANPVAPDVLPALAGTTQTEPFKWKNYEPRIGITYALGDAKKVLLKGSYARFADQLGISTIFFNNANQSAYAYYYWNDKNGDKVITRDEIDFTKGLQNSRGYDPKNPALPTSPNIIDPNLKAGTTDEVVAGVDFEVLPEFVVGAAYTYRKYKDTIWNGGGTGEGSSIPRVGLSSANFALCSSAKSRCPASGSVNGTLADGSAFSVPVYYFTGSSVPAAQIRENRPDYDTTYNGVELTMQKRLSNKWFMRGNFSYQDWKQHAGSGSCVNPTNLLQGTFGGSCPGDDIMVGPSGTGSGAFGNVFVNSKWNFNVSGLYQLPWNFNVGANVFGRQGYPFIQWVRINTGDGFGTQNVVVGPLDRQRNPNVYNLDLRLEKVLEVRPVQIALSLDVFNVLNDGTVLQRQGNIGTCAAAACTTITKNASYNLITQLQSPRVVRAGARVSF